MIKHWQMALIAAVAVTIGLLVLVPQLIAIQKLGDSYAGIMPIDGGDDLYYAARGQEIVDGHWTLGNPYLWEYKNAPAAPIWLPDFLLAAPAAFIGLPLTYVYWSFDFLLPALAVILTFILFFKLTNHFWFSLSGTTAFYVGLFLEALNRAPSPQLNFIFWLGFLISWLLLITNPRLRYILLAGLTAGLLFYIYPYYWTLAGVWGVTFLVIGGLVLRERLPWRFISAAAGLATALSGPYWWHWWQLLNHPWYKDTLARLGLIYSRTPSGLTLVAISGLLLALLLWCWRRLTITPGVVLVLAGLIASILTVNHHVVTGQNLEFSSHYWQAGILFSFLAGAVILTNLESVWLTRWKNRLGGTFFILVSIVSLWAAAPTLASQSQPGDNDRRFQEYAPVLRWIYQATVPEEVFLAGDELSSLIPIYTAANVFYTRFANLHYLPADEVVTRFILNHYSEKPIAGFIDRYERAIWGTYYLNTYAHAQSENKLRALFNLPPRSVERLPAVVVDEFKQEFVARQQQSWLAGAGDRRVDYVIWDKKIESEPLTGWLPQWEEVWLTERFVVFKLK